MTKEKTMRNASSGYPVIGQECICPDGLGRVMAFKNKFPHSYVQVTTYINDRQCKWSLENVELIPYK